MGKRRTQRRAIGTFSSNVTFVDGPHRGQVWGLQDWRPYRIASAGVPPAWTDQDAAIEFYITRFTTSTSYRCA